MAQVEGSGAAAGAKREAGAKLEAIEFTIGSVLAE
jgi:hypothetical protein